MNPSRETKFYSANGDDRGTFIFPVQLTTDHSQQSFEEELVKKFRVTSVQRVPLRVEVKLEEFDEDEETESNRPFRELDGDLM